MTDQCYAGYPRADLRRLGGFTHRVLVSMEVYKSVTKTLQLSHDAIRYTHLRRKHRPMSDFFKDNSSHERRYSTRETTLPEATIRPVPTAPRSPLLEPITPLPLAHRVDEYGRRSQFSQVDRFRRRDAVSEDVLPMYNSDTLPKYDDVVPSPPSPSASGPHTNADAETAQNYTTILGDGPRPPDRDVPPYSVRLSNCNLIHLSDLIQPR